MIASNRAGMLLDGSAVFGEAKWWRSEQDRPPGMTGRSLSPTPTQYSSNTRGTRISDMSKNKYAIYKPVNPYFDLVRGALGTRVDGEHFFDCVSDDIVYEVRYNFPGWPRITKGRIDLMESFRGYGTRIELHTADHLIKHVTDNGHVKYLPRTTDWFGRWRSAENASNDWGMDREAQSNNVYYSGIPNLSMQDQIGHREYGQNYGPRA
jgi:ketosteroid isomerase-like protein